jgi:LmbE family N-acetylglucosaminyl deacetylase
MTITVLAIVAHPDDAEWYAGGTLARYAAEGATVYIAVATDGRRGSFMEDSETLAAVRADEMRRAAALLGAQPPDLLGYPDMGLEALSPGHLRERFIRLIRTYRPDVFFTHDPYAMYEPHPDHRAVAWAAAEAVNYARLPLVCPEHEAGGLAPHFTPEQFFFGESLPDANRVVDITPNIGKKIAAMAEHRTQVVFMVEGILRQAHQAGVDPARVLGPAVSSPAALMAERFRAEAAAIGRKIGVPYAEAFRHRGYHPLIEAALVSDGQDKTGFPAPDTSREQPPW